MLLRVLVDVQVECQLGQVGAGVTGVGSTDFQLD